MNWKIFFKELFKSFHIGHYTLLGCIILIIISTFAPIVAIMVVIGLWAIIVIGAIVAGAISFYQTSIEPAYLKAKLEKPKCHWKPIYDEALKKDAYISECNIEYLSIREICHCKKEVQVDL